jgi:hypothetical protein
MISHLATLILAFMAFTASADGFVLRPPEAPALAFYQGQNCDGAVLGSYPIPINMEEWYSNITQSLCNRDCVTPSLNLSKYDVGSVNFSTPSIHNFVCVLWIQGDNCTSATPDAFVSEGQCLAVNITEEVETYMTCSGTPDESQEQPICPDF